MALVLQHWMRYMLAAQGVLEDMLSSSFIALAWSRVEPRTRDARDKNTYSGASGTEPTHTADYPLSLVWEEL